MLHLETGSEREVAKAELTLGEMFLLDEDMILFSDGINKVNLLDPWTGKKVKQFQEAGNKLSVSKEGQYVLVDGKLFDKNKQIATFSPTVDGIFSKKGHLFLRFKNQF